MWEDIYHQIRERTGQQWFLFAAGDLRDPNHKQEYDKYVGEVKLLEQAGMAHYFQFIPRGELYYKVMAICDFIVLPSLDETQSGTLARIIALNKPYVTTAPLEGLTSQTVESEGGLLFTTKEGLRRRILQLASSEGLRMRLGNNLKRYLESTVSWEVVTGQYLRAYRLAVSRRRAHRAIYVRPEF
jgi:glycosyltransferase involved in cell wall biosynthesis